jgi:hypothetical protein
MLKKMSTQNSIKMGNISQNEAEIKALSDKQNLEFFSSDLH